MDSEILRPLGHVDKTYYLKYFIYVILELQRGPLTILSDYAPIIQIVILARLLHFLLDSVPIDGRFVGRINLLKSCSTGFLGLYQLYTHSRRFPQDESISCSKALVLFIAYYLILNSLISISKQHRKDRANIRTNKIFFQFTILASFVPILANEALLLNNYSNLTTLRGILMALTMKSTSQSTSLDLVYLLHPISCVLGLWHPKFHTSNEMESFASSSTRFFKQIIRSLRTFTMTYCILVISANLSLIAEHLNSFTESEHLKLVMLVYITAQEFRFSHYFVSYLSMALFDIWTDPDEPRIVTCRLSRVEWPRSLVEVVVSWNITMHQWLKDYIFGPMRRMGYNSFVSILVTYLISSMLHGLKFHIWSVLLSLGYLTWVEHSLRCKLAAKLNACILARECKYSKGHKCLKGHSRTKYNSALVWLINLLFTFLAVIHLAYLGFIFVGNTDEATYSEALELWSHLYYYGHILGITSHFVSLAL